MSAVVSAGLTYRLVLIVRALLSVTVSRTVLRPGVAYGCVTTGPEAVFPSPRSHSYEVIVPPPMTNELVASRVTSMRFGRATNMGVGSAWTRIDCDIELTALRASVTVSGTVFEI